MTASYKLPAPKRQQGRRVNTADRPPGSRPVGLAPPDEDEDNVFVVPGTKDGKALVGFPKYWHKLLKGTPLQGVTPNVLRHSFASIANDLGFTESTIAALVGHSRGTITSRYIHAIDTALIMAADTIAGYIHGLLSGVEFKRASYALDRASREAALARLFSLTGEIADDSEERIAA